MDVSDPDIVFDEQGVCNHCKQAEKSLKEIREESNNLSSILDKIKKDGKGKEYDAIIGLSGGADSSYVLHNAVKLGLRLFAFSVDNGWNDPKADENVLRMVEKLKVPFYRYRIDIRKFRRLQAAFIKAGQKNIEIPTDHILMAATYELADKYGIKWILSGGNVATESIMPRSWGYQPRDLVHIKDIYRWSTKDKLNGLPVCGLAKWNYYKWIKGIKNLYLLDYMEYNREEAIKKLTDEYGYQDYHEKHCESIFTWWFQNYYLFEKFGIDKRKAHYSSMIVSGQMTREEAMAKLSENPIYPQIGMEYVINRYDPRPYTDFKTDEKLFDFISKVVRTLRKWKYTVTSKRA
jgi:N-acetyl sugar amidotransferase